MRADKIREAKQAQPFKPFVMHLADGREFAVGHPDFLFVGPVAPSTSFSRIWTDESRSSIR